MAAFSAGPKRFSVKLYGHRTRFIVDRDARGMKAWGLSLNVWHGGLKTDLRKTMSWQTG
jgi:hypothetical protein